MRGFENPLIARLRVGSVLSTQGGTTYCVKEPIVHRTLNGGVVPTVVLEKTARGRSPQSVLMTIGTLANLMRRGGRHKPGPGAPIDWSRVKQRLMARETTLLRRR